jgi:hypothetical protein
MSVSGGERYRPSSDDSKPRPFHWLVSPRYSCRQGNRKGPVSYTPYPNCRLCEKCGTQTHCRKLHCSSVCPETGQKCDGKRPEKASAAKRGYPPRSISGLSKKTPFQRFSFLTRAVGLTWLHEDLPRRFGDVLCCLYNSLRDYRPEKHPMMDFRRLLSAAGWDPRKAVPTGKRLPGSDTRRCFFKPNLTL